MQADIAHIRGERPGAARYAPDMTDKERNAVDNLILLLCPNHHREIDRLRPQDWSAEKLMEIEFDHEQICSGQEWAAESLLEHYSSLLASQGAGGESEATATPPPRLVIEHAEKHSFDVVNVSETDAFNVAVAVSPDSEAHGLLRLEDDVIRRLSPGGRWRGGLVVKTFGNAGVAIVRVTWSDDNGHEYDADFTL
ncbi:MAG TPA: hypothetical protein VMM60_02545 [Ilumatobacter sp.]|nr:hypothetical protein [Ilumatobacter sp.]